MSLFPCAPRASRLTLGWVSLWLFVAGLSGPGWPASLGASEAREARERQRAELYLEELAVRFELLQYDPARRIPAEILREARGLVVVRETRAGFILGGKSGRGIVLVKDGPGWGAPAIYRSREGGLGLLAGWQNATFVQVLMSDAAIQAVRTNQFRFGVGLRVTSGPRTLGDEAKTSPLGADVLNYADTAGLYGGLAVEGGALSPDTDANEALYGVDAEEVLFGRRPPVTEAGRRLVGVIEASALTTNQVPSAAGQVR